MKNMSKEDFEEMYCENSDITIEEYNKYFITLPCDCGVEFCRGWIAENKEEYEKELIKG